MAIDVGKGFLGNNGPPFRKTQIRKSATQAFRKAAPFDARTGHFVPLNPTYPVTVELVQAPEGGIPARVGATMGEAICKVVVVAKVGGSSITAGDLVHNGKTVTIKNWAFGVVGDEGDRICQVEGHFNDAMIIGYLCNNTGDPTAIKDQF